MRVVYRAQDEPSATREEYWRQVVGDTVAPLNVRFTEGPDARDQIVTGSIGAVRVAEVSSGPGEAFRTPAHIRRSDPGLYQLFVQQRGQAIGDHGGRRAHLAPGDLSLIELSSPFHCVHRTAFQAVCLTFPRASLPLRPDDLERVTGTRIPGGSGPGALVSSLVRQLPAHLDDADGARLGIAVIDLLAAALAGLLGRPERAPAHTRHRTLLFRIHAFIEERLGDPSLSPATIAAAHHISVRYLHKMFAEQGSTVAGLIRRRRLERCRRDLLDPAHRGRPVSAIAARHGLTDPAHFSRAFRVAYGTPPGEYRQLAIG